MIINSQFFITYYTGNSPLPLKVAPTNLTSTQQADYDKFIQSVGTIYGSQNSSGKIPKFWTKLTETSDQLGNKKYSYIPHPDSDLEYLDSKSSYYFIVRDDSALPLRIPAIGGLLLGFTDSSILPNVSNASELNTSLNAQVGNSMVLSPLLTNLQPYEEYSYEFKRIDSNWPIKLSSVSGIIKPSAASGHINSLLTFFPVSGSCTSTSAGYSFVPSCLTSSTNIQYIVMQLAVKPLSYVGSEILSDQFTVGCNDCLPKARLTMDNNSLSIDNKETVTVTLSNFPINKVYNYSIVSLNSEWPLYATPSSGSLLITDSSFSFPIDLVYCASSGLCPNARPGILTYAVPNNEITKQSWFRPSTSFQLSLSDPDYSSIIYYSDIMRLSCSDCFDTESVDIKCDVNNIKPC